MTVTPKPKPKASKKVETRLSCKERCFPCQAPLSGCKALEVGVDEEAAVNENAIPPLHLLIDPQTFPRDDSHHLTQVSFGLI
jgi:hypothetical protein